jgi:DSF synthase
MTHPAAPALSLPPSEHPLCRPFAEAGELSQAKAWLEEGRNILWVMMSATPRPCFNPALLQDIAALAAAVRRRDARVDFWAFGSLTPGMFNAGGDLALFARHIRARDKGPLLAYARSCVDAIHDVLDGFGVEALSMALVDGAALGGGFEAALAHDFVLARRGSKLGFPEVSFNLFPGMGGYSLVSRKAGASVAESLILGGEALAAEWHAERGLVQRLFDAGESFRAARTLADELRPKLNGARAMIRARRIAAPVSKRELLEITEEWVAAALLIEEKDIAYMERLVALQNRQTAIRQAQRPLAEIIPLSARDNSATIEA